MAVDHNRAVPVPIERLDYFTHLLTEQEYFQNLTVGERAEVLKVALASEQVEHLANLNFFLSEAYDIYNQRFR